MIRMRNFSEEEEQDSNFFDTREEISSVSDWSSDCEDGSPSVFNSLTYDDWTKSPESVQDRRQRFLKCWMGLSLDGNERVEEEFGNDSLNKIQLGVVDRMVDNSGAVLRTSSFEDGFLSVQSSMSSGSSEAWRQSFENGVLDGNFVCKIKNLDDGMEFLVDELDEDGMLSRLHEVESNQSLSFEEFRRTFATSPLVERFLKKNVNDERDIAEAKRKDKRSWLKKLGLVRRIVDRQGTAASKTRDLESTAEARMQRVKVHPSKKNIKDMSSLFTGQEFLAHKGSILTIKFSLDGQYLASGGEDGVVRVWKVIEDDRSNHFDIPATDPSRLYFTMNHLASLDVDMKKIYKMKRHGSSDSTCVVVPPKVFRVLEKPLHEFQGHSGEVLDLSWSKKRFLLSSSVDQNGEGCSRLADGNLELGPADMPAKESREGGGGENGAVEVNVGGGRVCIDVNAGEGCSRSDDENLELGPADMPAKKSSEIQKSNMVRKHRHVVPIKRSKGPVKITNTETAVGVVASSLYDTITTDKVNTARGKLIASSKELRARVKDPLPDTIKQADNIMVEMARNLSNQGTFAEIQSGKGADTVISELARKIINPDPPGKNQNGKDAGSSFLSANQTAVPSAQNQCGKDTDACNPSANHTVEPFAENPNQSEVDAANHFTNQTAVPSIRNEKGKGVDAPNLSANLSKKANTGVASCSHQNNVSKPSLMERNATARTFEWDDSIDDSSEGTGDQMNRIHLDSPKRKAVSPLKKYELARFAKRRKPKRWSLEEEDALREAVKKYGKGNWKLIWNSRRDVFQERTEVDLKDKWRNMTRYG